MIDLQYNDQRIRVLWRQIQAAMSTKQICDLNLNTIGNQLPELAGIQLSATAKMKLISLVQRTPCFTVSDCSTGKIIRYEPTSIDGILETGDITK